MWEGGEKAEGETEWFESSGVNLGSFVIKKLHNGSYTWTGQQYLIFIIIILYNILLLYMVYFYIHILL